MTARDLTMAQLEPVARAICSVFVAKYAGWYDMPKAERDAEIEWVWPNWIEEARAAYAVINA